MNYLIDTCTFLWFINADSKLSTAAKNVILNTNNDIIISAASIWEMAIKMSIGKLSINGQFNSFMSTQININNFKVLDINFNHASSVVNLPFHHRDPFDRLLISQCLFESLPIITADNIFN